MDSRKLQRLIKKPEGLKLEFKRELYSIYDEDKQFKEKQWHEFIKDILSLANGNVGAGKEDGYLIIGVGDTLQADGTRKLSSVDTRGLSATTILNRVNGACNPPLPNIYCEKVIYKKQTILVITIPFSPHLHCTRKSMTMGNGTIYHENTVFIRRAESIGIATPEERDKICEEKRLSSNNTGYFDILDERIACLREIQTELQNTKTRRRSKLSTKEEKELRQIRQNIEYLQGKKNYRQEIEYLSGKKRGEISYFRADEVNNQKTIWEQQDFEQIDVIEEMNEEIRECLEDAINYGYKKATVYCKLANIYNISGTKMLEAFKYCREAINKDKDYREAYEVGIEICTVLSGYDNASRRTAIKKLPEYEQKLDELKSRNSTN